MTATKRNMKIITVEDFNLKVADEALLSRPIRKLWNQDRSERKEKFYQQMSFMYHMVDPRSGYTSIVDKEDRKRAIIEQEGLPSDFNPSDSLKEAMAWYSEYCITPSQRLLASALRAADTVSNFLEDPTILQQTDDKGRARHQVSSVTKALKDVEGIVTSLQNLQKKVDQELEEKGKARGTQELTVMDTDFDQ